MYAIRSYYGEVACAALAGDASDRRYFRVTWGPAAGGPESLVLMQLGEPAPGRETDFSRMSYNFV